MLRNALRVSGWLAAVAVVMVGSHALAALTVDLRFTNGSTSMVIHRNQLDTDITMNVWVKVTGTGSAGSVDAISYANYNVISRKASGGSVTGDMTNGWSIDSNWNNTGSMSTLVVDINADGIKDIGSTSTSTNVSVLKVKSTDVGHTPARWAGSDDKGTNDAVTNGWEWQVETVKFHIAASSAAFGTGTTYLDPKIPAWTGATKAALYYVDGAGTAINTGLTNGTSVAFTLAPTTLTASVDNPGGDGKYHVISGGSATLAGTGTITDGFGSVSQYGWDLNNDGTYEVTSTSSSANVTYDYLVNTLGLAMGDNTGTLKVTTNDGAMGTGTGTLNIVPEPATVALLVTGGIAIAARRRRRKDA